MTSNATAILDEAYQRLHQTGPEFEGWLSNHGPMAAEAMTRHGHAEDVHPWLDGYIRRLEDFPAAPARSARTGNGDDPDHVTELAHGLAYWAARWQPIPGAEEAGAQRRPAPAAPGTTEDRPTLTPAAALASVPRIATQSGGNGERLTQLTGLAGWSAALAAPVVPQSPDEAREWLAGLTHAGVTRYLEYGHGNPVMLVHAATAPTAVLRTLPALDRDLWAPSATAAWDAAALAAAVRAIELTPRSA
jgi:hypothetical protein